MKIMHRQTDIFQVFSTLAEWLAERSRFQQQYTRIGFVPTMGALHKGHAELLRRSVAENDATILSIFVNPTQFNDPNDLEQYPRTIEADCELARSVGCTAVIMPTYQDMYPNGYRYKISEHPESTILCGAHRPGHFDGVLTVVMKLLQVSGAHYAYFGEKDYQQYRLIDQMCHDFFLPMKIIPCPIVRDSDGLALSSRNVRLSAEARTIASQFPVILRTSTTTEQAIERLAEHGMLVDYVEEHWGRRLGAVHVGGVRLIDNIPVEEVQRSF
jgi:pantoate--beta-alanine ligase